MRPTSKNKLLTVEVKPIKYRKFRAQARKHKSSMAELVRGFIDAVVDMNNSSDADRIVAKVTGNE